MIISPPGTDEMNGAHKPVVEWENFSAKDQWGGCTLSGLDLTLYPGSAVQLFSDSTARSHLLMRCLATLDWPTAGTYRFQGETLPFTWYENLLRVKRCIGYLYPMAAMVRNRTVEENLDYQAHYFNDTDLARHQARKEALVRAFDIERGLSVCPELVSALEQRRAIAVREILKEPILFLAEFPEEFVGRGHLSSFLGEIRKILSRGGVFVYSTNYRGFGRELDPVILRLENGRLSKEQES